MATMMTTTTTTTTIDPCIAPPLFHTMDQHQLFKNIKQQQQNQYGNDEADITDTDETTDVVSQQPQMQMQTQQIKIKDDNNDNNKNKDDNTTCQARRFRFTRSPSSRSFNARSGPMTESGRRALKAKLVMLTTPNSTKNCSRIKEDDDENDENDTDNNIDDIDDYYSTSLRSLYFSLSSSCSRIPIGKQQQQQIQKQIVLPLEILPIDAVIGRRPSVLDNNHAIDKSFTTINTSNGNGNTKAAGETIAAAAAAAGIPSSSNTLSEKSNKTSSPSTAKSISNINNNNNKKPLALPSNKIMMTSESMHPQVGSLAGSEDSDNSNNRKVVVRFDEYDETQMTLHINDFSPQEIQNVWYKREDYDDMIRLSRIVALKDEHRRRHQHHRQHHQHQQSELETRGLESWSILGMKRAHTKKEKAFGAVWEEQNRQWDNNYTSFDFDKIRIVYCTVSQSSQKEANERGISDENIAVKLRQLDELYTSNQVKEKRRRSISIITGNHQADDCCRFSSLSAVIATTDHQLLLESIENINVEELSRSSSIRKLRVRYHATVI
ncbi:hypothetical protein FRACYDRAFT_248064 [Fragilariopsis cylindrus CCMP1102]|uniref:Uncharacterized protein n=1 Tax=Fragilariopsis cylindrus CCMP1102 TaxID=635003 RepID=A0A1E7EVB6_9STRA|nr:hypothetical protein FRACYDRAFT_248064 [Fragilariopsis cylindrus CCMP1102]|eukprot:OEU09806.1 hypothetical protein FRACYDRAFT_248064 [Fragilariopsis cylindrus CCMP1102]